MAFTASDTQQALDKFFDSVDDAVNSGLLANALPLIGELPDSVKSPFAALRAQIDTAIQNVMSAVPSPADPGQAVADAITGLNVTGITATWSSTTGLDLKLANDVPIFSTGTPVNDTDIGASIGDFLKLQAKVDTTLTASFNTTFNIGTDGTVSLKDQDTPQVDVKLTSDLSIDNTEANLGVAKVLFNDADPSTPELSADFGLKLSFDSSGNFSATPTLSGSAGLDVNFASTDVLAGLLPNVSGEFKVGFGIENGKFDPPSVSVDNLKLDLNSYLGIVGSTFTDIAKTFNTGALGTMMDVATMPLPALDALARTFHLMSQYDKVGNVLGGPDQKLELGDLAVYANPALQDTVDKWYQAIGIIALIRQLAPGNGDGEINFGGGSLLSDGSVESNVDPAQLVDTLKSTLNDLGIGQDVIDFLSDFDISGLDGVSGGASGGVGESKGFEFDLFEHPEDILKILFTNQPVDLVKFDVPPVTFSGVFGGFFPVLGPLGFLLEGDINAKFDIDLGYDTKGLIDQSFADGFFVSTSASTGSETGYQNPANKAFLPVGTFDSLLKAGAGVGFAGSSLTVNAALGFGLYAYFEAADTDGKFRPAVDNFECIFSPIGGTADVSVNVTIEIGFGPFSISKNIPLANAMLGDFTVFSCPPATIVATPEAPGLATESAPDLLLNVGDRADQRILADDHGNKMSVALADDPTTPANESLNEAYVIGLARNPGTDIPSPIPDQNPPPVVVPGQLDVSAFGFTQRVAIPTNEIKADFKAGDDLLVIQQDVNVNSEIHGGAGNDVLTGGAGHDVLYGDDGNDVLTGGAGDDELHGGVGNDQLSGGKGADILDGGDGIDTVDYSDANQDSKIGIQVLVSDTGGFKGHGGDAEGDDLISIESITGTGFDDDIRAIFNVKENLVFDGGDGNDILIGGAGEDLLIGGRGADLMTGAAAVKADGTPGYNGTTYITSWGAVDIDLLRSLDHKAQHGGDAEGDHLYQIEAVEGSVNNDSLFGDNVSNLLYGNSGDDRMDGRGGQDVVDGGAGNDFIYADADGDTLNGNIGIDTLSYENVGHAVTVDLGASEIDFGAGIVLPNPAAAPDTIIMTSAPVLGERGLSTFENLTGTNFSDSLTGDTGDNRIEGRGGNDVIHGDAGFDILIGGAAADQLYGDSGIDWVYYDDSPTAVTVNLLGSEFGLGGFGIGGTAQGDQFSSVENILGSLHGDNLTGSAADNIIDPNISGNRVTETVDGQGGTDTLRLDYSKWGVDIGQGVSGGYNYSSTTTTTGSFEHFDALGGTLDTVNFTGIEKFYIIGTSSGDFLATGNGSDVLVTGSGGDIIFSGLGSDVVLAGADDDRVTYGNNYLDVLTDLGGTPPFYLDGGSGIDTLSVSLGQSQQNISLVGTAPGTEFQGTNLSLANGTGIANFEILSDVITGFGNDYLEQEGQYDNNFETGVGDDTIAPGLGHDVVDGGFDRIGIVGERGDTGPFLTELYFQQHGDLLKLDYSSLQDYGVRGTTTWTSTDFLVNGSAILGTNDGSYVGFGDSPATTDLDLQFSEIERIEVTGSNQSDILTGTYIPLPWYYTGAGGNDFAGSEQVRGNDKLYGLGGNDVLYGFSGSDVLDGGAGDDILIAGDLPPVPNVNSQPPVDQNELDTLTGGSGADLFVLGVAASASGQYGAGLLYSDNGDNYNSSSNQAIITDFNPGEGDKIQLFGAASQYRTVESNGSTIIYYADGIGGLQDRDELIATVQHFTGLDLNLGYITYVDNNTPAVDFAPLPDSGVVGDAGSNANLFRAANFASLDTVTVNGFSVMQSNDTAGMKAMLDGTSGGAGSTLTLSGSAEAIGTFHDDPFGLGNGIILSTGRVEDLPGQNTSQGSGVTTPSVPITFEKVGSVNGVDVYKANLSGLGIDLHSITLSDLNTGLSGSGGIASGFDLDAIILSSTNLSTVSSVSDLNNLQKFNVLDYSAASMTFNPGYQSFTTDDSDYPYGPDLNGAVNGLVNEASARLNFFDGFIDTYAGFLSLGRGGSLGLNLTAPLSTNGPVYVYVAEVGANGENLVGSLNASSDFVQPTGDLSTDLGAPGPDGDDTSLTYSFTPKAGDTAFSMDVVLFSEELPEFDGTRALTDQFSIKLNGKDIGALSNGAALSIKDLVYSGSGDLISNAPGTGLLANTIKADAYTKVLTITGAVDPGVLNTLTVEVKDGRDGYLDSGLLIKDGSFKTFVAPVVGVTFDPGTEGDGSGSQGPSGNVVVGGDSHITITPPAGASGAVTVTLTPDQGVTVGSGGPGEPVTITFNPGDGPQDVPVGAAPGAGPGDTGTIHVTISDPDDPSVDGQPVAPIVVGFEPLANSPPVITPPDGEIRVPENTTMVTTVVATDPNPGQTLTYSITGGVDQNKFTIDPATGALKFIAAPDFESPTDTGTDNVYNVVVGVTDNGTPSMSASQAYAVRVTDVAETSTMVVKFVSEHAAYRDSLGWYNTATGVGGILYSSIEAEGSHPSVTPGVSTASFEVNQADVGKIAFFLIPDGGDVCGSNGPSGSIKVIQLSDGSWAVALTDGNGNVQTDSHGKPVILDGVDAHALFTETTKNAGGIDYASSVVGSGQTAATLASDTVDGPIGQMAWEDIAAHKLPGSSAYGKPGDADYNDDVFLVTEMKGQTVTGDNTANTLTGGAASDVIYGLGGNDTIDTGAGSDRAYGGDGDDLFIHRIAENVGSSDSYDGGSGQDTLRLVLTGDEWARADVQSDVAKFLAYLSDPAGVATSFVFKSTQLTTVNIEKLEVMVEGVSLNPIDEAVNANADVLSVTEDAGGSVNLLGNDGVPDRAASVTLLSNGSRGTATLTPSLSGATQAAILSYKPSAALQSLRAGETATDTVIYKVVDVDGDSSTASVAITIVGVNDAAKISGTVSGFVIEDSVTKATGKLTVSDVDTGENRALAQNVADTYGSFSVDTTGAWTFMLNQAAASVQALAQGQSVKDTFTVKSLDGTASQAVTITINGCDDAAVIGTPTVANVTEDASVTSGKLKATGTISVSDADHDQSSFQTSVVKASGDLGALTLAPNGTYTYSVDNSAVQYLRAGETKVDSFTVKSLDGTSKTMSFTIHGADDGAVIGTPTVAGVTEDVSVASGKLKATGTISVSDADHDQSSFQTIVVKAGGDLGSLTLAANGTYTYSVDNSAVQYLGDGETKVDSFTIKSADGTSKIVDFTIHGVNEFINVTSHSSIFGTPGPDTFNFSSSASAGSTISGFAHGSDVLQISASGFGHGLVANGTPALVVAADHATATHAGSGGYFIFDNQGADSGTVFWDANGGSGNDAIALAKLTGVTSLTAADFHLV